MRKETPTRVRVGVTPDWQKYVVYDAETGEKLKNIIEADAGNGFVIQYRMDASGNPLLDKRGNPRKQWVRRAVRIELAPKYREASSNTDTL